MRGNASSRTGRGCRKKTSGIPDRRVEEHGRGAVHCPVGWHAELGQPWKGLGSGVYELLEDHRGDTFGAVYTVRAADAMHLLHAFQKKSKCGIATP